MNIAKLREITADDVLAKIGLQKRVSASVPSWIIPAVSMLGVGILIGAGLGLMLAPKSGRELRGALRGKLQGKVREAAEELESLKPTIHRKMPDAF